MSESDNLPARQTPAKDVVEVTTAKARGVYLPKAVDKIFEIMEESENERLQLTAATWLAERFLPKAEKDTAGETLGKIGLILAKTLREAIASGGDIPIPETIEANWKELEREVGKPVVLD